MQREEGTFYPFYACTWPYCQAVPCLFSAHRTPVLGVDSTLLTDTLLISMEPLLQLG